MDRTKWRRVVAVVPVCAPQRPTLSKEIMCRRWSQWRWWGWRFCACLKATRNSHYIRIYNVLSPFLLSNSWVGHLPCISNKYGTNCDPASTFCINTIHWLLGLERIHQVTNTIHIANTGWRIRMYSRIQWLAYSLAHSINWMREWRRSFSRQIHVGYIIHIKTETPIKTCNVLLAWEPPFKKI